MLFLNSKPSYRSQNTPNLFRTHIDDGIDKNQALVIPKHLRDAKIPIKLDDGRELYLGRSESPVLNSVQPEVTNLGENTASA